MDADVTTLAARVLGRTADALEAEAAGASFVALGGTSLRAVDLVARAERAGTALDLVRLLGPEPLAAVLAQGRPCAPAPRQEPEAHRPTERAATPAEASMLLSEEAGAETAWHLLFSADLRGALDVDRLTAAVQAVTDRHDALRTVFHRRPEGLRARVVPGWRARLLRQELELPDGAAGADLLHAALRPSSVRLLAPFERPPVVFVLTRAAADRHVLSLLVHHVVADGWSIGVIWRELFDHYRGEGPQGDAPSLVPAAPDAVEEAAARRIAELADAPRIVRFPSDLAREEYFDHRGTRLPVELDAPTRDRCLGLATDSGVTRNAVLLAAWSLACARRAGVDDLLLGLSWAGRTGAREQDTVGLVTTLLPVRCAIGTEATVREHVAGVGDAVRSALGARQVPFERLSSGLGVVTDTAQNALVQVAFAAHDEMVPGRVDVPGLEVEIHEGHCGGAVFDALLYVQRWGDRPRLCVEYATSALAPWEAAALVADFRAVLAALLDEANRDRPLRELLERRTPDPEPVEADGPADVCEPTDVWQLVESVALGRPDEPAVLEPGAAPLTYAELVRRVEAQAAALRAAGVEPGDRVVVAVPRSAREVVAVLAVLRAGAAYIGLEPGLPATFLRHVFEQAEPSSVLADSGRADELRQAGLRVNVLEPLDPWGRAEPVTPTPAAAPDPERVAYIAFTSGSTGRPKAVRVPHRAVCRLVADEGVVRGSAAWRFLRFAPLSFDASTLELFAPLAAGGTVVVHPDQVPTPSSLAQFLSAHQVTGLWLTAGLFRLVADHAPHAFGRVDQLLTGGDTVPAAQVRRVLEHCPGLRVTNGYGPTENTTFTTVHHLDDAAEVGATVPIGRPITGTGVTVRDENGLPVPYGAVGELCASGAGLALDYLNDPEATDRAFRQDAEGGRHYRTGDLVRWDADGNLRILGRRDRQVKIRGFRIELEGVGAVLGGLPGVADATVVAAADDQGETRLVAGVVVRDGSPDLARLRALAAERLPGHAVPALWALCSALPMTANGKVDVAALTVLALGADAADAAADDGDAGRASEAAERGVPPLEEIEDTVAEIWEKVLGTDDFGYHDRFADVGGDSLRIPSVRDGLVAAYPGCPIKLVELFRCPTIAELAVFLHKKMKDQAW
ncbi:non-ribosomal peptide synthetase [Streptacidiphilus jiangxiensis]|uniref:Amino acid adenylation domain-containing protein n=1 Tax=Streptacidiphilus jiangxiensis TaxID=235985 RepID=A0A1H7VM62_STRJI|nr:non-ribosomal peptide synthetase [Streptacidiphilus jiangxiensis]SEM10351.1 amino acid adenylation domain-containing protein [Streptacidiphilus jiangxiensis]